MNAKNILILYDHRYTYIGGVRHYLESFKKYSKHTIFYAAAVKDLPCPGDLSRFDVVMVHYAIRMCYGENGCLLSNSFLDALINFQGEKILFIQDEYDRVNFTKASIKKIGFNTVFTCVPEESIEQVYPKCEFPGVNFVNVLTGYVEEGLENYGNVLPISERKTLIAYRGRMLPFFYGNLGREKYEIALQMKSLSAQYGIAPVDIEWSENKRIYGADWFNFLKSAKATLITESGANIFDFTGELREQVEKTLHKNPKITYEKVHQEFLSQHEDKIKMNQISPKVFESIALKTALIGFEGEYSGIIKPYEHYIPLKKDYSNIEEVFAYLRDDEFLQAMVDRAYDDIIVSKRYSFKGFVERVDSYITAGSIQKESSDIMFTFPQLDACVQDIRRLVIGSLPCNHVLDTYKDEQYFNATFSSMLREEFVLLMQENRELKADLNRSFFRGGLDSRIPQYLIKFLKKRLPEVHGFLGKLYYKRIS